MMRRAAQRRRERIRRWFSGYVPAGSCLVVEFLQDRQIVEDESSLSGAPGVPARRRYVLSRAAGRQV